MRTIRRILRAGKIVTTNKRIPKPIRWLTVIGLLPIPGPFDELVLVIAVALLAVFCRGPLREAWIATRNMADEVR